MDSTTFRYSGTDNLEVMQEATNYNSFLVSLILRNVRYDIVAGGITKILDIGAGIGHFAEIIRRNGVEVVCMEPDLQQAERLKQKGFLVHTSMATIANNSFDFIYALNVLEHIEDDVETLVEWGNKLKCGGKMLVYVPAFDILFSGMDKKVGHFRRYNRKTLTQKATSAKLTPIHKAQYADSVGFFVTLVYKLLHKNNGDVDRNALIFYDRLLFPISRCCDWFLKRILGKNVFIVVEKI
jgi:2-polyprenyl-3-methyl-5-hydroxy-6-metoxy-1,4-benzoquinol methylase